MGNGSAPVIQYLELISDRDACRQHIADGTHNSGGLEIAGGVVVAAHDQEAGIMAMYGDDQIMQAFEVGMIARQHRAIIAYRICEVIGVDLTRHADIGGNLHIVTRLR